MIKLTLILLFTAGSCFALQPKNEQDKMTTTLSQHETILRSAPTEKIIDPNNELNILVWNIYKFKKNNIFKDLNTLSASNSFLILQEDHLTDEAIQEFSTNELLRFEHITAPSFQHKGFVTGVTTSSVFRHERAVSLPSPVKEPVIGTPKMTLYTFYKIKGLEEELLIVNIHGINFVTTGSFKKHIDQAYQEIAKHQGPVIFAGDFNTRNKGRTNYMLSKTKELGLELLIPENEYRKKKLDHILVRGLDAKSIKLLTDIHSSDHPAIEAKLKFMSQ